jgi:FkbM family methyltransferase
LHVEEALPVNDRIKSTDDALAEIAQYERGMPFFKMRVGDAVLRIAVPNHKCLYFATSYETREAETNDWIRSFPDDAVFFDVGANIGIFSLLASVWTNARIVAFEPHFASYYAMVRTLLENGLQQRVQAFPLALTDRSEFGSFFVADSTAGKSLNQFGAPNPQYQAKGDEFIELAAASTTLDRFVSESAIVPTHIKIDVDGLELAVLQGAHNTLAHPSMSAVMVELEGEEQPQIIDLMRDMGYARVNEGTPNAIFLRS